MPLLEKGISLIPGFDKAFKRQVAQPTYVANDYPDGFVIREYQDGIELDEEKIVLKGPFMPHQPFTFGGEQRIKTEYYPGNSEPAVQVFGPQEDDLTIKGRLRLKGLKNFKDDDADFDLRLAAREYQELIDAMRIRGNLVFIQMGPWHRWGFIKSTKFEFKTQAEISYEITFTALTFNKPLNTKIADSPQKDVIQPNKDLTNGALAAINEMKYFPTEMPRSLQDILNGEISKVSGYVTLVTSFVNEALTDVEQLQASANRALGLIKNARAELSRSIRRIQAVPINLSNLAKDAASQPAKTRAQFRSANHIALIRYNYTAIGSLLAALGDRFKALAKTVPERRVLVKTGDTLQKLSSRYYGTPDNWERIYSHNNLSSTTLTVGAVLEIPKA